MCGIQLLSEQEYGLVDNPSRVVCTPQEDGCAFHIGGVPDA